jgi:hypothetical protein
VIRNEGNRANRKREFVLLLIVSFVLVLMALHTAMVQIDGAVAKFYKLPGAPGAESLRSEAHLGLIFAGAWAVLLLIALFRQRARALRLLIGLPFVLLAIIVANGSTP